MTREEKERLDDELNETPESETTCDYCGEPIGVDEKPVLVDGERMHDECAELYKEDNEEAEEDDEDSDG